MLRSKMSAANTLSVSAGCTGYYVHALRNPMIKNTNFNVKIHDTVLELELPEELRKRERVERYSSRSARSFIGSDRLGSTRSRAMPADWPASCL